MDVLSKIINGIIKYKEKTNCKGVVVGISGGKDSTTVAMLAKKVWGDNAIGVLMPNGDQKDIQDSLNIVKQIGIKYYVVNIKDAYTGLLNSVPMEISDKSKTNIPPRLRMTTLYAIAQTLGYQVMGTGNLSERFIGWTTKWGDSAYDFNPIGNLTCTEVIELGKELAKEFNLDVKYIVKSPADGLTGKTDEDNFGFTYSELDRVIRENISLDNPKDETLKKIKKLHEYSEHKRNMPPII